MKRREFLAAGAGALAATATASPLHAQTSGGKEYYELRCYHFENEEKRQTSIKFIGDVAIPALNRIGVKPVGVFIPEPEEGDKSLKLWLLMPHASAESIVTVMSKLGEDGTFLNDGADYIDVPFDQPHFQRYESSILVAFDDHPKLTVPSQADTRVYQLRIYESATEVSGVRKVEMFNEGGEIAIFRRVGLNPVIFGKALVGSKLPNLTYMLGFDDRAAGEAAWQKFLADPAWKELKGQERYKNTVSGITNIWLKPAAGSQM
jgi:hypothetical protein